ncbi:30 kDa heat shock protein [Uncinocarpus reesii 1704]|uniref:30 kDa heat shock protein n=1 Tax=Uncinocarpus reesii (strain UAMH 1704) TaxID=336963 RepID=C4JSL7_UNCRE|nr:30 kDa heat shock protein [Uncinocarpus reesii 1704]EEP80614.1 30 kDa heat shock protein [Uncinocarpus reesii 1704]
MALFPRSGPHSEFGTLFRLLDDYDAHRSDRSGGGALSFAPKFDVRETKEAYMLDGDLPGIDQKDINIEFSDPHTLVVHGRTERSYSSGPPPSGKAAEGTAVAKGKEPETGERYWVSERSGNLGIFLLRGTSLVFAKWQSTFCDSGARSTASAAIVESNSPLPGQPPQFIFNVHKSLPLKQSNWRHSSARAQIEIVYTKKKMARLRQAPSARLETSAAPRVLKSARANIDTPTTHAERKRPSPVAREKDDKRTIVIHESEGEAAFEDEYSDEAGEKRGGSRYFDLSAEESDAEESDTGRLKEDNAGHDYLKLQWKRTLQPLGLNRANTLPRSRRVSAREENRYYDYLSDDENMSTGSGDYEKENDEKGLFNETKLSAGGPRLRRHADRVQRPVRKGAREPSIGEQYISEDDEQDGPGGSSDDEEFDSLDGFIVGDDEDISYQESTDAEAEESNDEIVLQPRSTGRRLLRGRRPSRLQDKEDVGKNTKANTNTDNGHGVPDLDVLADILDKTNLSTSDLQPDALSNQEENPKKQKLKAQESNIMGNSEDGDGESITAPVHSHEEVLPKAKKAVGFVTPPGSPSKPRLQSPKKTPKRIPPSPYRPSIDAFWSQDIVSSWNDKFTPKQQKTPKKWLTDFTIFSDKDDEEDFRQSSPEKAPPRSPQKTTASPAKSIAAKKKAAKREFDMKKASLAEEFFKELDNRVTDGEIQRLAAATGGVRITWSKKLNTTAGRATWKREHYKHKQPVQEASSCFAAEDNSNEPGTTTSPQKPLSQTSYRHHASIELADKVVDSDDRLFNTLAHEYCHLANYMISNVRDNPHGASFKAWAQKCKQALDENPAYAGRVQITTKHTYAINYKYIWCCASCAHEYGRHSKSIDTVKMRCGKCKGTLVQVQPKPRKTAALLTKVDWEHSVG